ncbi:MAG: hypothetical protein R2764_15465 [Bacteroidales bacterium]
MINGNNPLKGCSIFADMFTPAYRLFFYLIVLVAIVSCSKDEGPGVSPSFEMVADSGYISGPATVSPGQLMRFKIEANEGSEKLTNFFIDVENSEHLKTRIFDTAIYCSEFNWEGSFYRSSAQVELWSFRIRDRNGNGNGDVFFINADTNSAYSPIMLMSGVDMGAQNNIQIGGFFSLTNQVVYTIVDAQINQELIDMVFYYGEDLSTIASPGANIESGIYPDNLTPVNWEIRNTTRYIKTSLSESDFDNIKNDSIMIANYIDAEGKRKAKILSQGDVYVFKNQQNKLGLFLVNDVSTGNDGNINIDIKIQDLEK